MPNPLLRGSFPNGEGDAGATTGRRPVIFDILGPNGETSVLPEGVRLVLHVNPTSMGLKYARKVERIQTKGGFVEQHWGDDTIGMDFEMATGGFMRLYTGLSNVTSPNLTGGTRRETLAYDSYLDILALFHNNGSVYDAAGQVAMQGVIKVTFDGGVYFGWFNSFVVTEAAEKPYMFTLTGGFDVSHEVQVWKSAMGAGGDLTNTAGGTTATNSTYSTSAAAAASNTAG